jgi:NAD(P)-dependent dehydrogenase (short-subunit alcohol dehydrogenase family)
MQPSIILTGASRGLGAAAAKWLGAKNASVTLVSRTTADLMQVAETVEMVGGKALIISADITDSKACEHVVSQALEYYGRLDAVINNAGELRPIAKIADSAIADWRYNLEVNLMAPYYLVRAALPALRESKGRVINVSSGAANKAIETWSAYCVSKAALTHFTRVLDAEETHVTAVAFRPGVVDTGMQAAIRQEGRMMMPTASYTYFTRLKAEGKLQSPRLPARLLAWLALQAPKTLGGKFIDYEDPDLEASALRFFHKSVAETPPS